MKDIKMKKKEVKKYIFTKKIVERLDVNIESKKDISVFSSVLFCIMSLSSFAYVFFVSSTVFYAVSASKFTYQTESLVKTNYIANTPDLEDIKTDSSKISYINTNGEANITLK